jgi:hypothetical protein
MKHTPAPWFYLKGDEWSHSVVTHHGELPDGSQSYWTVASINKQREPEHEANARLIAAAPELLQALQEMFAAERANSLEIVGRDIDGHPLNAMGVARKNARAALAKATGENK